MPTSKLKHKRPQKVLAWGVLLHLLEFVPKDAKYWVSLFAKPVLSSLANTEVNKVESRTKSKTQ